jgi:hypothetical protein
MGQGGSCCAALASGWKEVVLVSKVGNRFTHHGPYQGLTTTIPTSRTVTGPASLGSDYGTQVRSVMMDACSPGEVRAKPNQLPGCCTRFVRELVDGTLRLHSTAQVLNTVM